jgi:undecaprenyl-phosphate galactose phosphotransferase
MLKKVIALFILILSDFAAILLSFFLAYLLRLEIFPVFDPSLLERPVFFHLYLEAAYMFAVWLIVFSYEKLYTKRHSFWEEVRLLLKSNTISFFLIMVAVFLTKQEFYYSRLIIVMAWLISVLIHPVFRYLTKMLLIKLSFWEKKVIILGTSESSADLIDSIKENKILGYKAVGCLTDNPKKIGKSIAGIKIFGHLDEIEKWKVKTGFEDIIVTLPNVPREKLIPLMKRWELISDSIRYIPRTGDLVSTGVEVENIGKILALSVRKNMHKPWNILIKVIFEYIITTIMFLLFLPFFLIIAVAIKIDSPGPVFFIQERLGKRKKPIRIIKFRSMVQNADEGLKKYLQAHPKADQEWKQYKKFRTYDPRVTRVGRFLRKYSLDELPQLLNVLKGDMNLVGPRPYIAEELDETELVLSVLLQVKPGITGLWQISGRSSLPFKERVKIDEYYIRNWSLWLDIVILLKTIKVTASGTGAF